MKRRTERVEFYRRFTMGGKIEWHWKVRGKNDMIIYSSNEDEGFSSKFNAQRNFILVKRVINSAVLEMEVL